MPDNLGEPFINPLVLTRPTHDSLVLPIHAAQHRQNIHQERRKLLYNQGTELRELAPKEDPAVTQRILFESDTIFLSSSDEAEEDPLVQGESSSETQMQRKNRPKKTKPDLYIETKSNGHANGHLNGHPDDHINGNGDTDGGMNSNIEFRRKHASLDDAASVKESFMRRDDFTLDDEPPPTTPQTPGLADNSFADLPPQDKRNFLLLVLLYFLQGIPLGLASGSVPFLLKPYFSYSQIGIFSLAIYPYSLKLLWSPIVDAVWSRRFGRRKSWITPIQTISGLAMIYLGGHVDEMMKAASADAGAGVWGFTGWWFLLVFLSATQDIAVDSWAISLLSMQNISYASTSQTVGLTAGSFLSHTVFLAFNAPDFANAWFRTTPQSYGLITLGGYMKFWGWGYLLVTLGVAVLKREEKTKDKSGIVDVYRSMWQVLKLKPILSIIIIHLISKIGFITNDAVTNLKLIDKGFGQANLALVILIDFPFEVSLGYYAGKWSTKYTPLRLWCWAFTARLVAAVWAQITIMIYPSAATIPLWYMLIVIAEHIYSTFMNTVMFVAVSAFHARIADPVIGGTYMTLLATVSNLGGTFPKIIILKLVDEFTKATCIPPDVSTLPDTIKEPITAAFSCAIAAEKSRCVAGGGSCQIERDGYYITNVIFVLVAALLFWGYIERKAMALQALPVRAWRAHSDQGYNRVSTGS